MVSDQLCQGDIFHYVNPKNKDGLTQGVAAKASAVGFCLGCGLFGSYNSL